MSAVLPVGAASEDLFVHVLASRAFAVGLVYGAFGYLATGLIAAVRHRTREGGGLAFAAAVLLAVRDVFGGSATTSGLILAVVLLALGGALAPKMRPRAWAPWYVGFGRSAAALAPGAIVLAATFPVATPTWLRFAAAGGALVAGVLVGDFDAAQGPRGAPFVLLAVSVLAVYYTVPDTELPLVMLGCAVPLALLSFPQPLRRLGPAGTTAAMGVFAWVVVVGGRGRAGAVIAGLAALGLLVVEPLGRRVPQSTVALGKRRRKLAVGTADKWLLVVAVAAVIQLALGAFCATIAGRTDDPGFAVLMTVPALVLVGGAAPRVLPLRVPSPRRHRSRRYAWMH